MKSLLFPSRVLGEERLTWKVKEDRSQCWYPIRIKELNLSNFCRGLGMAETGNFHPKDSMEKSENELNTVRSFTYHNIWKCYKKCKLSAWPSENLIKEIAALKLEVFVQYDISSHSSWEVEDAVGEFYRLWVSDEVIFESLRSGHADSSWTLSSVLK